jgi:hypothetical protein
MSNEPTMGSFYTKKSTPPAHRTWLFRPTTALPTPPVGAPAVSRGVGEGQKQSKIKPLLQLIDDFGCLKSGIKPPVIYFDHPSFVIF